MKNQTQVDHAERDDDREKMDRLIAVLHDIDGMSTEELNQVEMRIIIRRNAIGEKE